MCTVVVLTTKRIRSTTNTDITTTSNLIEPKVIKEQNTQQMILLTKMMPRLKLETQLQRERRRKEREVKDRKKKMQAAAIRYMSRNVNARGHQLNPT